MQIVDDVNKACEQLGRRLHDTSGLITTEADAQAELHAALLKTFPEHIPIEAEAGLLTHERHVWPVQGCRAYREISAGSSRATGTGACPSRIGCGRS